MKILLIILLQTSLIVLLRASHSYGFDCVSAPVEDELSTKKNTFLARISHASKKEALGTVTENFKGIAKKNLILKASDSYMSLGSGLYFKEGDQVIIATNAYIPSAASDHGIITFEPCSVYVIGANGESRWLKWLRSEEFKKYKTQKK